MLSINTGNDIIIIVSDMYGPQRMNPTDPLTLLLASSSGQHFNLSIALFYDQITNDIPISLSWILVQDIY